VGGGGNKPRTSPLPHIYWTLSAWLWASTAGLPARVQEGARLAPRADFSAGPVSGELPLSVRFEDRSLGQVTSWKWDFGDGTTSSERHPTHVYTIPGTHTVTLRVTAAGGSDRRVARNLVSGRMPDFVIQYGMNASENVWWQRGIAFADAMARASEFCRVVLGQVTREPAPLIPLGQVPPLLGQGWPDATALPPGEKAGARLFGSMSGTMPDGRARPYVLTWAGKGSCRLDGKAVVREANRTSNRVEVFVDPHAGTGNSLLLWILDWSDPTDPLRDAHVWLPGMEREKPILWPPFVEKVRAMNGGLGPSAWRTMDWSQVNQYGRTGGMAPFELDLAGRILPSSPSQGTKRGICPEFQVALCNAVGSDLHFCVPHNASDLPDADYEFLLRDAFTRIRDGSPAVPGVNGGRSFQPLASHLRLTVEFSNETWNRSFPVNAWLKSRAQASGRMLEEEVAAQIRRVFAVAEEVFSGPHAPRLRRFVGGWLDEPEFLMEVLSALGPDVQVDAAGPACYFGPRSFDVEGWMRDADGMLHCPNCPTPEAVVESARARIGDLHLRLLEHRVIAEARINPDGSHPRLELYEGGAAFAAGWQPWGLAASQAQRLPSMYDAYVLDFVPALIAAGVQTVHWYSFMTENNQGTAGPFGHWHRMDQAITLPVPDVYVDEGAPKAAAIYRLPPRRDP
jgi:PKD repeat protein